MWIVILRACSIAGIAGVFVVGRTKAIPLHFQQNCRHGRLIFLLYINQNSQSPRIAPVALVRTVDGPQRRRAGEAALAVCICRFGTRQVT